MKMNFVAAIVWVFGVISRTAFVHNTPPYIYAPILNGHEFIQGNYVDYLGQEKYFKAYFNV